MEINLTHSEKVFLKQYAKVYAAERKIDFTRTPIVVVEVEEYIATPDGYHDKIIYLWEETEYLNKDDLIDELREQEDFSDDEILEIAIELEETGEALEGSIRVFPVQRTYRPVAYFLTRAEAEKYCQYQRHNLKRPRVFSRYVGYSNNGDLECLMQLLLRMGNDLLETEEES
jgi:hypothetical protein